MKFFKLAAAAGFISLSSGFVCAQDKTLTLDECIAVALNENPTVKIADLEIKKADYSRSETLGSLLPTISFDAAYQRSIKKQKMYMDMSKLGGMGAGAGESMTPEQATEAAASASDGFEVGMDNTYTFGFNASMPIIAPQLWASIGLSDIAIEKANEQARSSKINLVNQVKNAYYGLLLAMDSRNTVIESYEMAKLTNETYEKRFKLGDASEYDVLRTSVTMKNIEPQIIQCDIAVQRARMQLAILMGIDVETEFSVAGSLADYQETMYADVMNLSTNLSDNSSLIMNEIDTRTLKQSLKVKKAAWYPTLALTANYNWNSMVNGTPFKEFKWSPYSVVGVALQFPLFQGGKRYNSIKQAQIQLEEMQYNRENLERTLNSQVKIAVNNIHMNVKQIASSNESVKQADRAHDIQVKSFGIGATSYLNLRDSELSLTNAKLAYYQSIYNYLVASSDLELLLGNAPIDQYTNSNK